MGRLPLVKVHWLLLSQILATPENSQLVGVDRVDGLVGDADGVEAGANVDALVLHVGSIRGDDAKPAGQ